MAMSLRKKLISSFVLLSMVPVGIVGSYCLFEFNIFSKEASDNSFHGAELQTEEMLQIGSQADYEKLSSSLVAVESQIKQLASSTSLISYLNAKKSNDPLIRDVALKELTRISEGYKLACSVAGEDGRVAIEKSMLKNKIGKSGYTFVVNSKGTIAIHPSQSLIGTESSISSKITANYNSEIVNSLEYTFKGRP